MPNRPHALRHLHVVRPRARESATLALHRDIETEQVLDGSGCNEPWAASVTARGGSFVATPEIMLAYAAAKTSRTRPGAGVVSLPCRHPFSVAARFILLDHLSGGRCILDIGPGALAYDAEAIGLDPADARRQARRPLRLPNRARARDSQRPP